MVAAREAALKRHADENHPIVVMGILAKPTAFFLFAYHWLYGNIPFSLLVFLIIDLAFAILFLDFLLRYGTLIPER